LVKVGNSYVFVSRGVGTCGPPLRIGCPPDVAIFEIKRLPRDKNPGRGG
jgi:predicted MPP superfamily phosphohydrolase